MKTLLATTAILVAISTSAFAGPKAQNLVAPVNNTVATLEAQVVTLAHAATSLAVQLRDAKDAAPADFALELEELEEELEELTEDRDFQFSEVNRLRAKYKNLEAVHYLQTKGTNRIKGELADAQDELAAVYEDLDVAYEDMDALDETILDLQEELHTVTLNGQEVFTAYTNIQAELAEVSEFAETVINQKNEEIAALEIESDEYWEETEELDAYVSELKLEVADLELGQEAAIAEMGGLVDANAELQEELDAAVSLNNDLIEALEGIAEVADHNAATQVLSFIASLDLEI